MDDKNGNQQFKTTADKKQDLDLNSFKEGYSAVLYALNSLQLER